MTEFNLDRIRFRWKGTWTGGTEYRKDDIVKYGATVYVALETHTADTEIATDFALGRWELQSSGQDWKGDWAETTFYKLDDLVKYGGIVYQCTTEHTSQERLEDDQVSWTVVASTQCWQSNWTVATQYKVNDVVKYNGIVYICIVDHISSDLEAGLEADMGFDSGTPKWEILLQSDAWKSNWTVNTLYRPNDVVRYGPNMYRCVVLHTSENTEEEGLEADLGDDSGTPKWEVVYEGIRYRSEWTSATRYIKNDIVRYGDTLWICEVYNSSESFVDSEWSIWLPGNGFENLWAASTPYQVGDIVTYGGYSYIALQNNENSVPSVNLVAQDTDDWEVINTGYNMRGDYVATNDYRVGDVVRRSGYLYVALQDQTTIQDFEPDTSPAYWLLISIGQKFRGEWQEVTEDSSAINYYLGDVVVDSGTSYICVTQNIADVVLTRPKLDAGVITHSFGEEVYRNKNFDVTGQATNLQRMRFSRDGSKLYVSDNTNPIYQYTLGTPWEILTATYDTVSLDPSLINAGFRCFDISPNGDVLIWYGTISDQIGLYTMSTPWDLGTATTAGTSTLPGLTSGEAFDIRFAQSGTKLFAAVTDGASRFIREYDLGTAYGISSITEVGNLDVTSEITTFGGFAFNRLGTRILVVEANAGANPHVYEYNLATPFTASTGTFGTISWVYSEVVPNRTHTIEFSPDGTRAYLVDSTDDVIYQIDNTQVWPAGSVGGDFWNVLIQGDTENVLENVGDMKTFGVVPDFAPAQGDKKIAIGNPGNTLKVLDSGEFDWRSFDEIPKVYYVSTNGNDDADSGTNMDAPFRTIKYACEYILADEAARAPATIFIKTGTYEEELPIVVPASTALVGDELRSTVVKPSTGYELSNMFYVRNASGIRNLTMRGLSGELGEMNANFTRRPTAGAFVSLDPGTGPDDNAAWINTRSPYIQNCSTFGTGCIGMKVDGSLHNDGFKSIVANDFTQILSDGIGYWANRDGRSELVSVFTYYCHIGYLATDGGFVRATNGNNSYGLYGSVAEGFNAAETPITAEINNESLEAQIDRVYLSNDLKVMSIGYTNAGQSYTSATLNITGSGAGINTVFEEFRQGAIAEIRVTEEVSNRAGGTNYTNIVNRAQSGTADTLTLSTSEDNTAARLIGQQIIIRDGEGAGQYGWIQDYDIITKVATIYRETDNEPGWDHIAPGWPITNTIDNTATYQILPRVSIAEPVFLPSLRELPSANNWNAATVVNQNAVAVGESSSAAYTTDGVTWNTASIAVGDYNAVAGTDAGIAIAIGNAGVASVSSNSGVTWADVSPATYFLSDEITPTTDNTTHSISQDGISVTNGQAYKFSVFAKPNDYNFVRMVIENQGFVSNGIAFFDIVNGTVATTALEAGWTASIEDRGEGWYRLSITATANATVSTQVIRINSCQLDNQTSFIGDGVSGTFLYGAAFEEQRTNRISNPRAEGAVAGSPGSSPTGWFISAGSELTSTIVGTGNDTGIPYIDLRIQGTVTAARDYDIQLANFGECPATAGQLLTFSSYLKVASGSLSNIGNVYLQINTYDAGSGYAGTPLFAAQNIDGSLTRKEGVFEPVGGTVAQAIPFIKVQTATSGAVDLTLRIGGPQLELGTVATSLILPPVSFPGVSSSPKDIPVNVLNSPNDFSAVDWDVNAVTVTVDQTPLAEGLAGYQGIASGNGYFIAVGGLDNSLRTSDNGTNWLSVDLPDSASPSIWQDIAFGKDTWVTIAQDTNEAAYSTDDGLTWTLSTLPATVSWQSITYGKGVFVAVAADSNIAAYSEDGITWYEGTLSVPAIPYNAIASTAQSPSVGSAATFNVTKQNNRYLVELLDGGDDYADTDVVIIAGTDVGGATPANDITITVTGVSDSAQGPITDFTFAGTPAEEIPEWSSVSYDSNGTFLAVANQSIGADTDIVCKSSDARVWIPEVLSTNTSTKAVAGGSINGINRFVTVSNGTSDVAYTVFTGSRAFASTYPGTGQIGEFILHDSGAGYTSAPVVTITDNAVTNDVTVDVMIENGVLPQPTFRNRGTNYTNAVGEITSGDGFADIYQIGKQLILKNLTALPSPGDSVSIDGINGVSYFVVRVESSSGAEPNLTATISISPSIGIAESPEHNTQLIIRQQYSQLRLTGHDFLDIGTGNITTTDYPDLYLEGETTLNTRQQFNEVVEYNTGRVFYTSTDQNGNFRVGELFQVEQSTGSISISADFFDLGGLQELRIGGIVVGGTNAVVREFSTDPTFAADSNNIVPTQRAIASYVGSRVTGGGADARANRINAGEISIFGNEITSVEGANIEIPVTYIRGIPSGSLAAYSWFLTQGGSSQMPQDDLE